MYDVRDETRVPPIMPSKQPFCRAGTTSPRHRQMLVIEHPQPPTVTMASEQQQQSGQPPSLQLHTTPYQSPAPCPIYLRSALHDPGPNLPVPDSPPHLSQRHKLSTRKAWHAPWGPRTIAARQAPPLHCMRPPPYGQTAIRTRQSPLCRSISAGQQASPISTFLRVFCRGTTFMTQSPISLSGHHRPG